mgnify:FL=1
MSHGRPVRPARTLSLMLGITLAGLGIDLLMHDAVSEIFKEGHSVEAMSVVILIAAAAFWWNGHRNLTGSEWHVPVILILMALRELDVDKRFTSEGVLQLRLYTGSSPLWEKALGLAVVLLILVCAWRLARISLARCWRGLLRGANWAWLVATGAALIVIAKAMDGLDRKLAPWGIAVDPVTAMRAGRIEEVLELVAYIMLAQAGVYVAQMVEVPQTMPHVSPTWRPR